MSMVLSFSCCLRSERISRSLATAPSVGPELGAAREMTSPAGVHLVTLNLAMPLAPAISM